MTAPPNLRGWCQGWPVDRTSDMRTVRALRSSTPFTVHREIAPIIEYLVNEVERRGYLLHRPGQVRDDWSYVNRPIRGRNVASNHSWGLAIDIDATQYPLGSRKRLPSWIVDLFKAHGFDYGGDWKSRPDPMHFEFAGWPSDARRIAARLGSTSTAPRPTTPTKDWFSMATKAELEAIVRKVVAEEHGKTRTWIKEELIRVTRALVAEIRRPR